MSTLAVGFRGARPAMVPGQSAASGGSAGARAALGFAAASAHRHRGVSHRPALAAVPGARYPDFAAGPVRAAGIFFERIFPVSDLAGAGPGARRMGVLRHDGTADPAKTSRLPPAADRGRP